MSNPEHGGAAVECPAAAGRLPEPTTLAPREVPLGGPRAMTVRRTLPHRDLRTIGAWCFVDDFGPSDSGDAPMTVPPHPHMGLQTVSWLLSGSVSHHDSTGGVGIVTPGEVNVMTAGRGISHSEYSVSDGELRGLQLWVALPEQERHRDPSFTHHDDLPRVEIADSVRATVFLGAFAGAISPAPNYTPIVGVEVTARGPAVAGLPLRADFEYGLLALDEGIAVDGAPVPPGHLRYLADGHTGVDVTFTDSGAAILLGGEPLAEDLLMWWNFVGRSHAEIAEARDAWQTGDRFGTVVGDDAPPLPAPALPNGQLRPRPNRPGT